MVIFLTQTIEKIKKHETKERVGRTENIERKKNMRITLYPLYT